MEYISVREASEKWNITPRRVQELCKNGSLESAKRFGKSWMIPKNSPKPVDKRKKNVNSEILEKEKLSHEEIKILRPKHNPFLIHTDLYNAPGTMNEVLKSLGEYHSAAAKVMKSQFDLKKGDIDELYENAEFFKNEHKTFYSTISTGMLLANISVLKGDIYLYRQARQHIYEAPYKDENERQELSMWLAINDMSLSDTTEFPDWFKIGKFDGLPADSYCTARMFYVKYLFIFAHELACGKIKLKDVEGLGLMRTLPYIIEPMISQAKMERTLILEIYLHLIAATVYHDLGEDDKAIIHIDIAIKQCLPDKLYAILAEYKRNLDGLLDERLELSDKEALKKTRELYKKFHSGWIKIHNILLERNISESLTLREREVAKLAAFGMGNNEIAKRLCIELSSVKRYIFSAMNKVGAQKRTELGLYI